MQSLASRGSLRADPSGPEQGVNPQLGLARGARVYPTAAAPAGAERVKRSR